MIKKFIYTFFLLVISYSTSSSGQQEFYGQYKKNHYPDYYQVKLPTYESPRRREFAPSKNPEGNPSIKISNLFETMPTSIQPPQSSNEIQNLHSNSVILNQQDSSIPNASDNNNNDFIEIETPQPEKTTTPVTIFPINDSPTTIEPNNEVIPEFKQLKPNRIKNVPTIDEILEKLNKKNTKNKSLKLKLPFEKTDEAGEKSVDFLENKNSDLNSEASNPISVGVKPNQNNSNITETKALGKSKLKNRVLKLGRSGNKKRKNRPQFPGFGYTFKTLKNFFKMDPFFNNIAEPVENQLEQLDQKSPPNDDDDESDLNLYSLIAKAAALNRMQKAKLKKNQYKVKIANKSLTKRSNDITKKKNPSDASGLISIEQAAQLQEALNNFRLTMKMLANVDMYVSTMLKSYIERLAQYVDTESEN